MIDVQVYAFGQLDADVSLSYMVTVDFSFAFNPFILQELVFEWSLSDPSRYTDTNFSSESTIRLYYDQMVQD